MPPLASDLQSLFALEPAPDGVDAWLGLNVDTPWPRVYGGQVAAQALRAAQLTIDNDHQIHSLHGYFIRGGQHDEPVRYEVDRIRNGRSFSTRRVVAMQSSGAIFNLSASFQTVEEQAELQLVHAPEVDAPEHLEHRPENDDWTPMITRRRITLPADNEVASWLRLTDELAADPALRACAMTFTSDDLLTEAVWKAHPNIPPFDPNNEPIENFIGASLDHAMWFHRPGNPTEWQLHSAICSNLINSRGLVQGQIFDNAGIHLATTTQEVLLRHIAH